MLLKTEGGLQPGHRPQKQSLCSGKNRIDQSCVARYAVQDPPFPENICCLAGFLGETADSGHRPGLDRMAFCGGVKNDLCENKRRPSRIEIRADNGRFSILSFSANRSCKPELWLQIIWKNGLGVDPECDGAIPLFILLFR